ncbi:MAG TPA: DUF6010 family protein [Actinomycetota bacterium]|jgi:drug/metabolite transporter (DMT)-like permease|nr:DUF6010 family protein [Actinomycetota bacterium]
MATAPARTLPLPAAITHGGRSGWLAALVAGVIFGGVTLIIPSLLSPNTAFGLLAILLGMIASVYLGYALADGRLRAFQVEYVGMVAFAALATVALARHSALLLALGYLGHGLWDLLHHRREVEVHMPRWYVPVCLGYDTVVAIYVLIRF